MSDVTIPLSGLPGLREYAQAWLSFDPWNATWRSKTGRPDYLHPPWWLADGRRGTPMLPLDVAAARAFAVDWLAEGERCPRCGGSGYFSASEDGRGSAIINCSRCNGSGWTRPQHDVAWSRDIPGALAANLRLIAKGEAPLLGALGPWQPVRGPRATWERPRVAGHHGSAAIDSDGWRVWWRRNQIHVKPLGTETGAEGRAAADVAARRFYWLLDEPEAPTPPATRST